MTDWEAIKQASESEKSDTFISKSATVQARIVSCTGTGHISKKQHV